MIRKLALILLALVAARMARRALRREAEVVSLLWTLIQVTAGSATMPPSSANTAKARSTEDRLSALIPRVPVPQASPGPATNNSYGATNNSYGPSNSSYTSGNNSYDDGDSNQGNIMGDQYGAGIPGGGTFTADGTAWLQGLQNQFNNHVSDTAGTVTRTNNLINGHNALRDSYSSTVSAFNAHIGDHGALVNTVSALRTDHSNLITAFNALRSDHSNLITQHNGLVTTLQNTNLLH
jgi:hypothetical protein